MGYAVRALLGATSALLLVQQAFATGFAPDRRANYSHYAALLTNDLLDDYVKSVPPTSNQRLTNLSDAGTDVSLQIRFFKIESIEAANGKLRIKSWLRTSWTDTRLSWDPADYGGITQIRLQASSFSDPETSDIWLPDITPLNALTGLMHTFDPALALVTHDGVVYWSRPGILEILCRFTGLGKFPFGALTCPFEVGGWMTSGVHQGLVPAADGCAKIDFTEESSLASYTAYNLTGVTCEPVTYFYPCCADEPWPMIKSRISVEPMAFFYTMLTIIPCVAFSLASFAVFFMSFQVGERLGYGVTLCLAMEVSKTTISTHVPICGELLWMELFFQVHLLFTLLPLLESCLVLGIAFNSERHLIPPWLNPLRWQWLRPIPKGGEAPVADAQHAAGTDPTGDADAAVAGGKSAAAAHRSRGGKGDADSSSAKEPDLSNAEADLAAKLLFFENLFFKMDPNGSGSISTDDIRQVLAFCALDLTGDEIEHALFKADSRKRDGRLDRVEFVDLCADLLWRVPVDQLESAAANYAAQVASLEQRVLTRWRGIANDIDRYCRFWVPFSYVVSLFWLYSVQVEDKYDGEVHGAVQQENAWDSMSITLTSGFPVLVITCAVICTVCLIGAVVARIMKRRHAAAVAHALEVNQSSSMKNLNAHAVTSRVRVEP